MKTTSIGEHLQTYTMPYVMTCFHQKYLHESYPKLMLNNEYIIKVNNHGIVQIRGGYLKVLQAIHSRAI